MQLSTSQLQALKAWVQANANSVYDQSTANTLNALATPDYWVFRTAVTTDKARDAIVWSEVLATSSKLPAEERWAFDTMMANGDFDPGVENNRVGLSTIFTGAGFAQTRLAILNTSTRKATLGEKILSTPGTGPGGGNGSATTASAVLGFHLNANGDRVYAEGEITVQNLVDAANS